MFLGSDSSLAEEPLAGASSANLVVLKRGRATDRLTTEKGEEHAHAHAYQPAYQAPDGQQTTTRAA